MAKEGIVIGVALTIIGIWLSLEVVASKNTPIFVLIYTLIITALGIGMIALNKEEDKIEKRRDKK